LFEYCIYDERESTETTRRNEEDGEAVQTIKTLFNSYGGVHQFT
jgi:hypothetical protein